MATYYNTCYVSKQFKTRSFVKLLTKNLKLKYPKLVSCQIGPFRILKQIGGQVYKLALLEKYTQLHLVFSIQLLEEYHYCHDNTKLMKMPNLEDPQDKQEVEKVQDKQWIKSIIYYLVKQASWLLE